MYKELGLLTVKKKKAELPEITNSFKPQKEKVSVSTENEKKDKPKKIKTLSAAASKFKESPEKEKSDTRTIPIKVTRDNEDNKSISKNSSKKIVNYDVTKEDKNTIQLMSNIEIIKLNASAISNYNNNVDVTKSVPKFMPPTPKKFTSNSIKAIDLTPKHKVILPAIASEESKKCSIPIQSRKNSKNSFNLREIRQNFLENNDNSQGQKLIKIDENKESIQSQISVSKKHSSNNFDVKEKQSPFCGCFSFFN
jgi:hypothetical protein